MMITTCLSKILESVSCTHVISTMHCLGVHSRLNSLLGRTLHYVHDIYTSIRRECTFTISWSYIWQQRKNILIKCKWSDVFWENAIAYCPEVLIVVSSNGFITSASFPQYLFAAMFHTHYTHRHKTKKWIPQKTPEANILISVQ